MRVIDMLKLTVGYAEEYRVEAQESLQRNNHMNEIEGGEKVQQRHIDAILVDFINHIAVKHGVDYGLYTKDLTNKTKAKKS